MNSKQRRQYERQWKYHITFVDRGDVDDMDEFAPEWEPIRWCDENFGWQSWRKIFIGYKLWDTEYSFQFKKEKDAMLFALRWL